MFEYLEKIDDGSMKQAHKMSYDGSIFMAMENGDLIGKEETIDGEPFYTNLALTQKGRELLRFSRLTLEDIENSYQSSPAKEWLVKPLILAGCKWGIGVIFTLLLINFPEVGNIVTKEVSKEVIVSDK
ncbi:hypothetical protein ACKOZB_004656 [Vibrio parahaemolyticus]